MNTWFVYFPKLIKQMPRFTSLALIVLMLSSCATTPTSKQHSVSLFHDEYFTASETPFDPKSVFDLTPEMHAYIRNDILTKRHDNSTAKSLLYALYDKDKLKLEYDSSYTRTAKEAFKAKSGNCISLVIMTAAFAKNMNLSVQYQSVFTPENISRDETSLYYSDHVNLVLGSIDVDVSLVNPNKPKIIVDFLTPANTTGQRSVAIAEHTVLAMYMNNRAAEQLREKKINDAYWWAKRSIESDPTFLAAYNTLGVVYERHDNLPEAKQALLYVINIEPANLAALSNLARIEFKSGNPEESARLNERIKLIKPTPPFYYFDLGMAAMQAMDFTTARDFFISEINTSAYNAEFHYWLAGAYIGLKDRDNARKHLIIAIDNATTIDNKNLYEAKLRSMHSIIR
jgi:Tfp pilus assembly protein PilF